MDAMYDPHTWSKQRREEALREAQRQSLAKRARGYRGTRFELGRFGSTLSGYLSLLKQPPEGSHR
jgi:hypothetical protein